MVVSITCRGKESENPAADGSFRPNWGQSSPFSEKIGPKDATVMRFRYLFQGSIGEKGLKVSFKP